MYLAEKKFIGVTYNITHSSLRVILSIIIFCWCILISCVRADSCIGLVLSSGGSRGAYHAGALKGLVNSLPGESTKWDIVSGVSAGAINTLSALLFNIGDESNWADFLVDMWTNIKGSDVYSEWTFREVEGLLFKSGIYDNSPLKKFLHQTVISGTNGTGNFTTDRKVTVSATKMNDGSQVSWSEKDDVETLVQAVIASSTIPGIFPVAVVEDEEFTDGSVFAAINILSVIDRCIQEKNSKHSEIVIDMVLCTPLNLNDSSTIFSNQNSLHILLRSNYLSTYSNTKLMIERAKLMFPDVSFRFIIAPEETIDNMGLDFDKKNLVPVINQGIQDATKLAEEYLSEKVKHQWKFKDF